MMRTQNRGLWLLGVCGLWMLAITACSESEAAPSNSSDLQSETTVVAAGVEAGADGEATGEGNQGALSGLDEIEQLEDDSAEADGEGVGGASGSGANGGAEALKLLVNGLDEVPSDVVDFFNDTDEERIDELAENTCARLDPDLPITELGVMTIVGRGDLTPAEQELLDLNEYRVVVGAVAGVYCPDRLPVDTELLQVEFDLGDPDAYREALPKFLPPEHQALEFVDGLDDERLETLYLTACEATDGGRTVGEIGVSVLQHYNDELTEDEQAQIEFGDYIDFVGSLLGWFCPDQLVADSE